VGGEFIGSSMSIFIMLSANTEKSVKGISLQQLLALVGYVVFVTTKLIKFVESMQKIALAFYFVTVISAILLAWLFKTNTLLKGIPKTICHHQGKYFLARSSTGRQRFAGNLNPIRLTFKEYFHNSVMKHLQQIEIYEATKQEADTYETNLSLMVDSRTEDCYKLLISKLILAKPGLVITINQRSSASVANLRTDSDIVSRLIK
jgi:hypothetical protein